jgi:hypothetical protein
MATFVIVHGAWSGAHAWRWVRPLLRAAGHEVMVAQPLQTFAQPVRLGERPPALPRTYVLCTEGKEGQQPPPYVLRVGGDPDWRLIRLRATHTAHVTAPEEVARTLIGALRPEAHVPGAP